MNNVLDYEGYRFFFNRFDPEKETILSVNHDFLGYFVNVHGYLLYLL
jgi:hypothetical protein